jgi:hypothetical protein
VVTWRALGVRWTATFENNHVTTGIAEEFIAELQIALVTLAEVDLCLLPLNPQLHLTVSPKARHPRIVQDRAHSDPTGLRVEVKLAGAAKPFKPGDSALAALPVVAALIHELSTRPAEQLFDLIKEGLLAAASRVHTGRPYRELYNEFAPAEHFDEPLRQASTPLEADRIFNGGQNPLLSAKAGSGPTGLEPGTR